jgi:hypothetical protein
MNARPCSNSPGFSLKLFRKIGYEDLGDCSTEARIFFRAEESAKMTRDRCLDLPTRDAAERGAWIHGGLVGCL